VQQQKHLHSWLRVSVNRCTPEVGGTVSRASTAHAAHAALCATATSSPSSSPLSAGSTVRSSISSMCIPAATPRPVSCARSRSPSMACSCQPRTTPSPLPHCSPPHAPQLTRNTSCVRSVASSAAKRADRRAGRHIREVSCARKWEHVHEWDGRTLQQKQLVWNKVSQVVALHDDLQQFAELCSAFVDLT
jgi:hypothetical protein